MTEASVRSDAREISKFAWMLKYAMLFEGRSIIAANEGYRTLPQLHMIPQARIKFKKEKINRKGNYRCLYHRQKGET